MDQKRIVLAGGSGFIGRALTTELLARNYTVVIFTRSPRSRPDAAITEVAWDGENVGAWSKHLDGAEAVVNLSGQNINCPHTPENLRAITASRVNSVRAIAKAISQIARPPRIWVQASAVGFYGDTGERVCDETTPAGTGSLAEICREWENAFNSAVALKTRKVVLRIGFVLGRDGGALPVLSRLTRFFLGGAAGSGRQFISWIHLSDLTRMFIEAIECESSAGTFNAVAPDPVTNAEFMRKLRRAWHRPWSPPAPELAVRLGSWLLKSEASLALTGCRAVPQRFLDGNFKYQFAKLPAALEDLCGD
jgi:hypothetical protein